MGDNIENKALSEIKIAKLAQKLPNYDILKNLTLHIGNVFANTTKRSGVSTMYSYEILPGQNTI